VSENHGKLDRRLVTALIVLVAVVGIFAAYHFAIQSYVAEWGRKPNEAVDPPPVFTGIDSSACIACHTSEAIISLSTVGQDEGPKEDAGG
jgi:hypothetical protein